jgi:hypothetical protein
VTDHPQRPASPPDGADPARRTAAVAGALYLVTFVTSIPALVLKAPVLRDPSWILDAGDGSGVRWAVLLEVVLALACVGTAVVLLPVVRRGGEAAALGFVAARTVEASLIVVGAVCLLAVVTLGGGSAVAGADPGSAVLAATTLVAVHDGAFLLGPGLVPAVNAVLLGSVLYRCRLVPRVVPVVGLVGAPLLAVSATATLFGVHDQVSVTAAVAAVPIALWELSLGVWLVVVGFRPTVRRGEVGAGWSLAGP